MRFSTSTKRHARLRQNGRCALCGEKLDNVWEEAHHIWPDSLDGRDHPDNCVILCDVCHGHVHNQSNFQSCIVAPKSYFRYFKGRAR